MATETAIIDFDKTFLTIDADSIAAFVDSCSVFAEETVEADNELLYATAKRTVDDDEDEPEDDDDEEEDEDEDLEDDEDDEEDEDEDEFEDDEDEDDDEDADDEEEDEDVDELRVSSRH
jgi:hypothetical protein